LVFDDNGKTYEIGAVEGSKSKKIEERFQKTSLAVGDILGA
jgi:hypothetical protein